MRWIAFVFLSLLLAAVPAGAQAPIRQSRGADPEVDYRSLTRYGPWDDRNYQLTAEDLALLPEWEAELVEPLPAFFRVEHAQGPARSWRARKLPYPRSALNVFLQRYGGYPGRRQALPRGGARRRRAAGDPRRTACRRRRPARAR